jgi:hypothetical protein
VAAAVLVRAETAAHPEDADSTSPATAQNATPLGDLVEAADAVLGRHS